MITWNLRAVFKARGVERPYTFLVKAGLSPHTATSILNNDSVVMRLNHVEVLCEKLNCTPNDLMVWKPDPNKPLPEGHQLFNLKRDNTGFDLTDTLKTISLDKLNEIVTMLADQKPNP